MTKTSLILVVLVFVLLTPLVGCSDFDDQPGMAQATATSTRSTAPTVTQTPTPMAVPSPTVEPGGWVWKKVSTDLNPEQNPVEVCPEKPGRCTWFTVTQTGCTIDRLETQTVTGSKVFEYRIQCSPDAPPDEVWPGQEYRLRITCSADLKYAAEGNSWIEGQAAISYYYLVNPAHKQFLQPHDHQFWFRPWHPDYDGTTGQEWVFFGPWGELGDEFELVAHCGAEPCKIHWKFRLEAKE